MNSYKYKLNYKYQFEYIDTSTLNVVVIQALLGDLWAKKSAFLGQKQCFLGKKCTITWYVLHISLS